MSRGASKRRAARRAAEEEAAKAPVEVDLLQYWATYPVGGSGLGIGMQTMIKKMAREILGHRGVEIDESYHQRETR